MKSKFFIFSNYHKPTDYGSSVPDNLHADPNNPHTNARGQGEPIIIEYNEISSVAPYKTDGSTIVTKQGRIHFVKHPPIEIVETIQGAQAEWQGEDKPEYKETHEERHKLLHCHLGELVADYTSKRTLSDSSIRDLIKWSAGQLHKPTGPFPEPTPEPSGGEPMKKSGESD